MQPRSSPWPLVIGPLEEARAQRDTQARGAIAHLAWLAGTWNGSDGPLRFEERWTPPAGGAMLAVSRTLKGDRMVAFEFLRIVERDGRLIYIAQPNGRPPTEFTMTAITADSVTFENPRHDFPKMIRYTNTPMARSKPRQCRAKGDTFSSSSVRRGHHASRFKSSA
jgi:hypothetical protein